MRHAKLFGIALLATMVSVGCGQAPTMNADVSGYGGSKYGQKPSGSSSIRANVISDLNIGHRIDQNIDQEQTGQSNEQSIGQAIVQDGELPLGTNNATQYATNGAAAPAVLGDSFPNIPEPIEQSITLQQECVNAAVVDGDIEDVDIGQSNLSSQIQGDENAVGGGGGNGGWSSYKQRISSKKRSR